jgi:hypothetical protein
MADDRPPPALSLVKEDSLFGKIALHNNFVSPEQLEECLVRQREADTPKLLGMIMLERGYITRDQLRLILEYQKKNLQRPATDPDEQKEDIAFGFLAVKLGYTTLDRVYECVREQARMARLGLYFRLGEIFVNRGYLSAEQVGDILARQNKTILECPSCASRYNVIGYQPGRDVRCTKCSTPLTPPSDPTSITVDEALDADDG